MNSHAAPSIEPRDLYQVSVTADPWNDARLRAAATQLGDELGLTVVDRTAIDRGPLLALTDERVEIRSRADRDGQRWGPVYVDLEQLDTYSAMGRSSRQPLAKAVTVTRIRGRRTHVVDATAGFGADAWLLASMGCQVTAYERCPIIAALLSDGLRRAAMNKATIADRICVILADSKQALRTTQPPPDVVYLDTMFPPKRKNALERKSMRLLRQIVGADSDAIELFDAAMNAPVNRVVVKRPLYAASLVSSPTLQFKGKSCRYDVYVKG